MGKIKIEIWRLGIIVANSLSVLVFPVSGVIDFSLGENLMEFMLLNYWNRKPSPIASSTNLVTVSPVASGKLYIV